MLCNWTDQRWSRLLYTWLDQTRLHLLDVDDTRWHMTSVAIWHLGFSWKPCLIQSLWFFKHPSPSNTHKDCVQIQGLHLSKDPAYPVYVASVLHRPSSSWTVKAGIESEIGCSSLRSIPTLTWVYLLSPSNRYSVKHRLVKMELEILLSFFESPRTCSSCTVVTSMFCTSATR